MDELEAAAQNYAYEIIGDMGRSDETYQPYIDAFIAGANWMRNQGVRSDKVYLPDNMKMIDGVLYQRVEDET